MKIQLQRLSPLLWRGVGAEVFPALILMIIAFTSAAQPSTDRRLSIAFRHMVDSVPLQMDTAAYKNELGQAYSISNFKYYISNIVLKRKDGKEFAAHDHYLITEEVPESKLRYLRNVPAGEYTSISFLLGVDSLHNCSGAQGGELDPSLSMFWAWNTGYIFLKLEGKASASTAPAHVLEYHIGGYKSPHNSIRKTELTFKQALPVEKNKTAELKINVNIAEIFRAPNTIDFKKLPAVMEAKNAKVIADNYQDMFSTGQ